MTEVVSVLVKSDGLLYYNYLQMFTTESALALLVTLRSNKVIRNRVSPKIRGVAHNLVIHKNRSVTATVSPKNEAWCIILSILKIRHGI